MADPRSLEEIARWREAAGANPRDAAALRNLGDALRRAGPAAEAIAAYRGAAERLARDGLLVQAIAISKAILELDPAHVETQAALAELYARRGAESGARPPPPTAAGSAAPDAGGLPPGVAADPGRPATRELTGWGEIALAAGAALDVELEAEAPRSPPPDPATAPSGAALAPALPRVPIFSDLSRDAFVEFARAMALRRAREGEEVLVEGDAGTAFYVVASGRLAVTRRDDRGERVVLARLGDGDFFGEMALLSGAPRSATVVAEVACELLEFRAEVLLALARRHPHVAASLRRFYRRRLLANAMAVSPIFRPFGKEDRKLVVERFRARPFAAGEVIVREGEPSDGLYVVLEGALDVVRRKGGGTVAVARLREGDLFGEMSCLRKAPATATVAALRGGTLLRLGRAAFDELIVTHPRILEVVAELVEERAESLDAILAGRAQWTDEGLVLV